MSKRVLGKGIGALLGDAERREESSIREIPLSALKPNPHQPRREFPDAALRELADSIKGKGILQPVLAEADREGSFIIVAGERRVRAARLAGLDRVPVIVRRFTDAEKLEIALVENVQREDLTPIEEAFAYRRLMEMMDLTQEQIAVKVGKDRSTVANALRLLKLPGEIQEAISRGRVSPGHARALLALANPSHLQALFRRIVEAGISVREAEEIAAALNAGKKPGAKASRAMAEAGRKEPEIREIEQKLIERLGTKVEVRGTGKKGRIEISYFSTEDLERLLDLIAGSA